MFGYQTSAALLRAHARHRFGVPDGAEQPQSAAQHLLLIEDLYIKACSYAWINKLCFWLALIGALALLLVPVLPWLLPQWPWLNQPGLQTTLMALSALLCNLYQQYKQRQTQTENLMRQVLFSDQPIEPLAAQIMAQLQQLDTGFNPTSSQTSPTRANH